MSLAPGARIGNYTIVAKIGEGGMGEVYRATDARLGRDVAIKVLPDNVAGDADRLSRFEREAKALAALNHFNIAQIYGFEGHALVMELLDGVTLRERLSAGALSTRKALDFGVQIARGLAAAHERGIIHRDLKPENIFILNDGQVKILDFGLARSASFGPADATREGTAPGVVMGTAGYMSPEQVRGQIVDARSDVFALGAVLHEMLTGQRAFRRDSTAETMSAIVNDHPPDVTSLRADVSPTLDRIVQHCLEKTPSERFQSARDVAFALDALSGAASKAHAALPASRRWERPMWAALTSILALVAGWLMFGSRPAVPAVSGVMSRTLLVLPENVALTETVFPGARLALSPDGSKVAYAGRNRATGVSQIYHQDLAGGEAKPLPGSINGGAPSWSPDGRQVAFSDFLHLYRVSVDGGAPVALLDSLAPNQRAAWNREGVMVVGGARLLRFSAQGGPSTVLGGADNERYGYPHFLPDGDHYLYGVATADRQFAIRVASLNSSGSREILKAPDLGGAAYAAGALIYARGMAVFAQPFDPRRLELSGTPISLAMDVDSAPGRGAAFAVSENGLMVYQASERYQSTQLTWFDRAGRKLSTVGEAADFTNIELGRDGKRLLASAPDPKLRTRDIYIIDVTRGVRQRFTLDPSEERSAVWSPDQTRIIYTSRGLDLYGRASDLSGEERRMLADGASKDPYDWSPDGRSLLYRRTGNDTGNDLWLLPLDDSGPPRAIAATRFNENGGNFSPDGKWIVYVSDESGQPEIYATAVAGGGRIQISSHGGAYPRWRSDGREILYLGPDRMLMSAPVAATSPALEIAAPKPLFALDVELAPGPIYDVTADGSRFIVAARVPSRIPPALTVLHNWQALMREH